MKLEKEELPLHQKGALPKIEMEVDLEEALDIAGAGKYQFIHCSLMVMTLSSAILEMIGSSYVLPAAACDLALSDSIRGFITSIPNIGVILTAPIWGRVADNYGRKPVLLMSTAVSGFICLSAAVMPNLIGFAVCKLAGSLFLSCPSSLGFAYAGELMPQRRRDYAILICNALLMFAAALSPVIAWGVLSYDWQMGLVNFRPWRVLTAVYALPLILTAICLTQTKESPKFLMTKGKQQQALDILRHIYAINSGKERDKYRVTALKNSVEEGEMVIDIPNSEIGTKLKSTSALALLRPPHLKWLALTGFLMFGLFSLLNGLFLFAPSTINLMMSETSDDINICTLLNEGDNQTTSSTCEDSISHGTFQITVITGLTYSAIVMLISLTPLSKKILLVGMFGSVGVTCLISVLTHNRILAGVSMSALQVTGLGIGPLTAYAVQLFPTNLRGTAVGSVMMFGRLGSVAGANAAGTFLAGECTITFYAFTTMLFLCAALSFLLPSNKQQDIPR